MKNIRLTVQYDGTRYLGWQRPEKDGFEKTVSYKIISILKKMTGEEITLHAGARTEPGVHALRLPVSFRMSSEIPCADIRAELNRYLPMDIAVPDCSTAPERFRADLNALSRTYEYRICTAPVYDIFSAGYTSHLFPAPDISAMKLGASFLTGRHDFSAFSGVRGKKNTVKVLHSIDISYRNNEDSVMVITLTADDFLYRMPSLIIGSLLEAGLKMRAPESLGEFLAGKEKAGSPCDAKGLLLHSVRYP